MPNRAAVLRLGVCVSLTSFNLAVTAALVFSSAALCQAQAASGATTVPPLALASAAFSGGQVVKSIQLTGQAQWISGSLQDSGPVVLTASSDGSSNMQLSLLAAGVRTESRIGTASNASCLWSGPDGVSHAISAETCWHPSVWFLPAIVLQYPSIPSYINAVDLGLEKGFSDGITRRHLQIQTIMTNLSQRLGQSVKDGSTTDLYLDASSMLPTSIGYTVAPDDGSPARVSVQVWYSQYQKVSGVMIPFRIQRFVNGALQLDVQINSAQIN